jgi:hypothetical protein
MIPPVVAKGNQKFVAGEETFIAWINVVNRGWGRPHSATNRRRFERPPRLTSALHQPRRSRAGAFVSSVKPAPANRIWAIMLKIGQIVAILGR